MRNPPWTDKILVKHWAALEARVGAAWMPVASMEDPKQVGLAKHLEALGWQLPLAQKERDGLDRADSSYQRTLAWYDRRVAELQADLVVTRAKLAKMTKRKPRQYGYREYGCGHYGCVMPTGTPGLVVKITTDQTEASFVAAYLSMKPAQRPVGIVPYHRLIAIRSESRLRRPVFVLWREEAQHLGADGIRAWIRTGARDSERDYYANSFKKVMHLVGNCLDAAREVRDIVVKRRGDAAALITRAIGLLDEVWEKTGGSASASPQWVFSDPARSLAFHLTTFRQNAEQMTSEPMGNYIGQGLLESLDAGLLLADVHLNNIGMPTGKLAEEIGRTPIITDPGHAIALDDRYSGVQVEEL